MSLAQRMHVLQGLFQMSACADDIIEFVERSCQSPRRMLLSVWHESSDWLPLWVQQFLLTFSQSQKCAASLKQISSRSLELLQSHSQTPGTSLNVFPYQLVWVYAWSGFYMGTTKDLSLRFFATIPMKDQVLRNVFEVTFSVLLRRKLSRNPHSQDILQSTSC